MSIPVRMSEAAIRVGGSIIDGRPTIIEWVIFFASLLYTLLNSQDAAAFPELQSMVFEMLKYLDDIRSLFGRMGDSVSYPSSISTLARL